MPRRFKLKLRNVQNVAASKTALIECPIGRRYHYIGLEHGYAAGTNTAAGAATNITEIRVKINGNVRRVFSGTQLRDLNLLHGTQYDFQGVPNTAPGCAIPIFFAEPWRKDVNDQLAFALPTQWQGGKFDTLQIEVDLAAAGTPTLTAFAVVDDVIPDLKGAAVPYMTEIQRLSVAAAGTSIDINTIDKKGLLQQLSVYADSGGDNQSSLVKFQRSGVLLHELSKSQNFALLTHNDMFPTAANRTAKITDIVFDHDDVLSSAEDLSTANELTVTVEAAAAMSGTITALIQRVVPAAT